MTKWMAIVTVAALSLGATQALAYAKAEENVMVTVIDSTQELASLEAAFEKSEVKLTDVTTIKKSEFSEAVAEFLTENNIDSDKIKKDLEQTKNGELIMAHHTVRYWYNRGYDVVPAPDVRVYRRTRRYYYYRPRVIRRLPVVPRYYDPCVRSYEVRYYRGGC